MNIKGAVARRYAAPLALEPLEVGEPGAGEILVRLVASGVSRVDLDAIAGGTPLPFVPGAEGAGIVERTGAGVDHPVPGDAVVVLSGRVAGDEPARHLGGPAPFATPDGDPVHGLLCGQSTFATHVLARAADAVVLPAEAPLELAAILGGEFLRGAGPLLDLPDPAAAVVITGAGIVGLAACLVARARGVATVIVADPSPARCERAIAMGATITVPDDDGLAAVVRSIRPDGAALALETSGTATGRSACRAALAPGGIFVDAHVEARAPAASSIVSRLAAMAADGSLPLAGLIDFFPFEQVNDALAARADGTAVKPVLRFSLGAFGDLDRALKQGSAIGEAGAVTSSEGGEVEQPSAEPAVTA